MCILLLIIFEVDVSICTYLVRHTTRNAQHPRVVLLPVVWGKHLTGPHIQHLVLLSLTGVGEAVRLASLLQLQLRPDRIYALTTHHPRGLLCGI